MTLIIESMATSKLSKFALIPSTSLKSICICFKILLIDSPCSPEINSPNLFKFSPPSFPVLKPTLVGILNKDILFPLK